MQNTIGVIRENITLFRESIFCLNLVKNIPLLCDTH